VDKKGNITGVDPSSEFLENLTNRIVNKMSIYPQIETIDIDQKRVLSAKIARSGFPISYEGRYYERVGNTTREMSPEKLQALVLKGKPWDSITDDFSLQEIDPASVVWVVFMLFPGRILGVYISDPLLAASGTKMFRVFMAAFFIQGLIFLPVVLFQSMGKAGKAGFLMIARQVLLFAPIVLLLPLFMGLEGVWTAIPIADTLIVLLALIFVMREFRSLGRSQPEKTGKQVNAK